MVGLEALTLHLFPFLANYTHFVRCEGIQKRIQAAVYKSKCLNNIPRVLAKLQKSFILQTHTSHTQDILI